MQLHNNKAQLDAAKTQLVVIGSGKPHHIEGFRNKSGFRGRIYTEPSLRLHGSLGLQRDVRSTFSLSSVLRGIVVYGQGFRQTKTQGDPWQQGGVFVIQPGGDVVWLYRSRYGGDHPSIHAVVGAARHASRC